MRRSTPIAAYRLYNGDDMLRAALHPGQTDPTALIIAGPYPDIRRMQPHLHASLKRVLTKALSLVPAKRFPSATQFRHALESCRPVVSWTPDYAGTPVWWGEDTGGRTYHAQITKNWTNATFRVSKGTGGKLRNIRDDEMTGPQTAVVSHSAKVLGRLAQTGR